MWINVRDRNPLKDGTYLTQMMHGGLEGLSYTQEGGWNTHYDSDGNLCAQSVIADNHVARWFDAPEPPEVPYKCFREMKKAGGAYRVYISQVWSYTKEIEAGSRAEANEEAERIADGMTPANSPMSFGDTYVEVEEIK